ncbi:MAG: hybrid sensor histidine kinase/response regulator [Nitrospirota bacterium]
MSEPQHQPELFATFKAEADEHLGKMDRGLLALEKNPADADVLHELFRVAHTLKGAAWMMGFVEIKEIAHKIEDLFGLVTSGRQTFHTEMADRIFEGVDAIRALLEQAGASPSTGVDAAAVCGRLAALLPDAQAAPAAPPPSARNAAAERPSETASAAEKAAATPAIDETIRIPLSRVNRLLNLVGELVINKVKSSHKAALLKSLTGISAELQSHLESMTLSLHDDRSDLGREESGPRLHECLKMLRKLRGELFVLSDTITTEMLHIDPVVDELQRRMKEIRMLPCTHLFDQLSRVARDLSHTLHKEIDFIVMGGETELDKKVLEEIKGPLIHLLRNCIDHGIETPGEREVGGKPRRGRVELSARHQGDRVVITVNDDGRGVDPGLVKIAALKKGLVGEDDLRAMTEQEALNLIFMKGFSTSEIITDVSGRGVGLDAVRTQVEGLKGQVTVSSRTGAGTTFRLELPLTIALIQALLVRAGDESFALPLLSVEESIKVPESALTAVGVKMAAWVRGHLLPVVRLDEAMGYGTVKDATHGERGTADADVSVVIIASMGKRVGFIVDAILGDQEIYIKTLGPHLGKVSNLSGATVLGTGELVLIVDVADLIRSAQTAHRSAPAVKAPARAERPRRRILVVEDSLTTRELERGLLESRGFSVDTAADGLEALQKVAQGSFDLVLSDIEMPQMNGFDLCRALRASDATKAIPVVFLTTLEKESDKRRGIEVGAQGYIVKNAFNENILLQTIDQLTSA